MSEHFEQGIEQYSRKNYEAARTAFLAHLRANPHDADGWYNLACSCLVLGSDKEARDAFQRCVCEDPGYAETILGEQRLAKAHAWIGSQGGLQRAATPAQPETPTRPSAAERATGKENAHEVEIEGERFSMAEMTKAQSFRTLCASLRGAGAGSVIFGLIAIAMGASSFEEVPINGLLVPMGMFLALEGIWLIAKPRPAGLVVDGFALMMIGAWNLFITIAGGGEASGFAALGGLQIFWGIQSIARYKKFAGCNPGREAVKQFGRLLQMVWGQSPDEVPNAIVFQADSKIWKARLLSDRAVFVAANGEELVFSPRSSIHIATRGKKLLGKSVKFNMQIRKRELNGTIQPQFLERAEQWLGRPASDSEEVHVGAALQMS